MYIWLISLVIILGIGLILCLQRPPAEIIAANKELMAMSEKIRTYYRNRPDYWGLSNSEVIKHNLYVGKMTNNILTNGLGKGIVVGSDELGSQVMPGSRSFAITYTKLNNDECIALASFNWKEEDKLGLISMAVQNSKGSYEFSWGEKGLPLSRGRAKQFCGQENSIMWRFE